MRTAMMAMTTSSSIKVNAGFRFRWCLIVAVFQRRCLGREEGCRRGRGAQGPLDAGPGTPRAMASRESGRLSLEGEHQEGHEAGAEDAERAEPREAVFQRLRARHRLDSGSWDGS